MSSIPSHFSLRYHSTRFFLVQYNMLCQILDALYISSSPVIILFAFVESRVLQPWDVYRIHHLNCHCTEMCLCNSIARCFTNIPNSFGRFVCFLSFYESARSQRCSHVAVINTGLVLARTWALLSSALSYDHGEVHCHTSRKEMTPREEKRVYNPNHARIERLH